MSSRLISVLRELGNGEQILLFAVFQLRNKLKISETLSVELRGDCPLSNDSSSVGAPNSEALNVGNKNRHGILMK